MSAEESNDDIESVTVTQISDDAVRVDMRIRKPQTFFDVTIGPSATPAEDIEANQRELLAAVDKYQRGEQLTHHDRKLLDEAYGPRRDTQFAIFAGPLTPASTYTYQVGRARERQKRFISETLTKKYQDLPPAALEAIRSTLLYNIDTMSSDHVLAIDGLDNDDSRRAHMRSIGMLESTSFADLNLGATMQDETDAEFIERMKRQRPPFSNGDV